MRRLTRSQARRAAIRATGLDRPRPQTVDVRHFRQVVDAVDVVQLDSVNVLARAHELMFFARIGAYDTEALRQWLWHSREMMEGWIHVASLVPMASEPLHRFRQEARLDQDDPLTPEIVEQMKQVLHEVETDGPLMTSGLSDGGDRTDGMWGWSPGRQILHKLFATGKVAMHERTAGFVPVYAAHDHVVPADVSALPTVQRDDAHDALILRAARSQGWGTADSLRDHHRLPYLDETRAAIARLEARGDLVPVDVEGFNRPTWAHVDMVMPRSVDGARALVAPFDPLVWYRDRIEALWDMHYRIEIYTPAAKREYGYYTLPFLLGERLVGRVDLKADRKARRLVVKGAWSEPHVDLPHVAKELAEELTEMAAWLGLADIEVEAKGDLTPHLRQLSV